MTEALMTNCVRKTSGALRMRCLVHKKTVKRQTFDTATTPSYWPAHVPLPAVAARKLIVNGVCSLQWESVDRGVDRRQPMAFFLGERFLA